MSYLFRDPDPTLWKAFKARAKKEGHSLRWLIETLIRQYVARGL
jgi:hypothetical protein